MRYPKLPPERSAWCPTCGRQMPCGLCLSGVGITRFTDTLQDVEDKLADVPEPCAPYAVCGRTGLEED